MFFNPFLVPLAINGLFPQTISGLVPSAPNGYIITPSNSKINLSLSGDLITMVLGPVDSGTYIITSPDFNGAIDCTHTNCLWLVSL